MATDTTEDGATALRVASRALAMLAMHSAGKHEGTMLGKADFLAGLGLPMRDVAQMLGTTVDSLGALRRQAKSKKGGRRARKSK